MVQKVLNATFNDKIKTTSEKYRTDIDAAIIEILRETTIASCLDDSILEKIRNLLLPL